MEKRNKPKDHLNKGKIKNEKDSNTFLKKYSSVISITIGGLIGYICWLFFLRCEDVHCVNHYYPIPVMGIFSFNFWIISVYFFKK